MNMGIPNVLNKNMGLLCIHPVASQCFEQSHWAAKVSKKVNRSSEELSGQLEIEHLSPMLAPFEVFYGSQ